MKKSRQISAQAKVRGTSRWPGFVFTGLGLTMFAIGLGLCVDRVVVLYAWPEIEARVVESRIETVGSQHSAIVRVEFDYRGRKIETLPASDYRSDRYGWIAEAVD